MEGHTQTSIASWPGPKDRRAPEWIASGSSVYTGVLTAITLAIAFRLSVIVRALPLAAFLLYYGATITTFICAVMHRIGQPPLLQIILRFYRDLLKHPCLWFSYFAGHGLCLGSILAVWAIYEIGIAYAALFIVASTAVTSTIADYLGWGWSQKKVVRVGHLQAVMLLILGTTFLMFDLFLPPEVLHGRPTATVLGVWLSVSSGLLFTTHTIALAEISPLLGSRARAASIILFRIVFTMPVWILTLLPPQIRAPKFPLICKEMWILVAIGSITLTLALICSGVAASEGNTSFSIKFWASFASTSFLISVCGYSSLAPRSLDMSHFLGLSLVAAAAYIGSTCNSKERREQLRAVPNRKNANDHCEICIRNDREIMRMQQELNDQQRGLMYDHPAIQPETAIIDPTFIPVEMIRNVLF